jgi:hypothetical protein
MTERATELSSLKQEVAELWSRFRREEQSQGQRHGVPELVARATRLALGPARRETLRDSVADATQPTVDIINDWADPLPSALHVLRMLRHPGGLIKPMVRERAFLRRKP